jgi:hypothetical protein
MTPAMKLLMLMGSRRSGEVYVLRSGTSLYIRQPYDTTYALVRKLSVGTTPSASAAGTVDFVGVRKVSAATQPGDIATAYEAATGTLRLYGSTDNGPPEKLNGMYLGGAHGAGASFTLTKTGHGLTDADVGDVGTDTAGTPKSWVLVRVPTADTIVVTAANTGTATKWILNGTITGTTITFAGAGEFTFTGSVSAQIFPLAQDYSYSVLVDGRTVNGSGPYIGRKAEVRESYGIPNPASWMTALIAEKGTLTPRGLNHTSNDTHVEQSARWLFDKFGAQVGYFDHYVAQGYGRSGGSTDDYWGGQQWQVISRQTGETVHQYVPDLVGAVGGYDFKAIADITANASAVTVAKTDCVDPTNPASHFAQIIKDAGTNPTFGFVHGYARHTGVGVPAARASLVTEVWQLSTSEKQYIRAVDAGAGATAVAGETYQAVTYNRFYDMAANPTYTVNAVVEYEDGTVHWIFDCHDTLTETWVALPESLIGRGATVVDSTAFTLHSAAVTSQGLQVSTTGGYGRAVVRIG